MDLRSAGQLMPKAFDRCVVEVKRKGAVSNPYAVCRASMGSDEEIEQRMKAKKKKKKSGY